MLNIIIICHGNICRSPVGEILLNDLIKKNHLEDRINVISRATSLEEIGNDIYSPMKEVLRRNNIDFKRHSATRITREEYENADYIYYMDENNLYYLERLFGHSEKYHLLREYLDKEDIEDPWYTDRYQYVFNLIKESVESIFSYLKSLL